MAVAVSTKYGGTGTENTAFTYVPAPTVTSVTPTKGPAGGGTTVTINGTKLTSVTGVTFGTKSATSYTIVSTTKITAVDPSGTGTVGVTVTSPGGSATLTGAYTYVPAPTVTGVTPAKGRSAGGTSVTIRGTNFTTVTAVKFGASTATSFTRNSSTQITAVDPAGSGSVAVSVTSRYGGTGSLATGFTYVAGPTVTSVTPSKGSTAGGTSVVVKGTNFTTVTAVKFGSTTATSFTRNSSTQITAVTPPGTGKVTVTITTRFGSGALSAAFSYVPPPTVTRVTPSRGPTAAGTVVTITGTNFTTVTSVTFGTAGATAITRKSSTQLTVHAPAGTAGQVVNVSVSAAGGTGSLANAYTYVGPPTISGITPTKGPKSGGTLVTVTGTNLTTVTSVTFGTRAATTVTSSTPGQVTVRDPASTTLTTVGVSVTAIGGSVTKTRAFTYVNGPSITSVTPTKGPAAGGTTVIIKGSNFTTVTAVKFGTSTATSFTRNSTRQLTAVDSPGNGTVAVTVTTKYGGSTARVTAFTYVAPPTVTSVTPTSGPSTGGTSVTILGTGFTTVTGVTFGTSAATSFTRASSTRITAVDPSGSGTVAVAVTTRYGTGTKIAAFTYVPPPSITTFTPSAGPTGGGTVVTITGTHLLTLRSVKFGTVTATSFTATPNGNSVTAKTPAHAAGTVAITVTGPGGSTRSTHEFMFVGAPTVTAITPTTGSTRGGTKFTITGTHRTGVTSVKFGTSPATTVGFRTSSTAIGKTPVHSAGKVTVTVTTPGGSAQLTTAFTFVAPGPTITGVTPASGSTKGGTSVTIAGQNLSTATTVTFGGADATTVTVVSPTRIRAKTPAHTAGRVSVSVTTPGGTAARSTAFTYVTPPPTTPVFVSGVACYKTTELTCVAAGATKDGAVLLVGTKRSTGSFSWETHRTVTSTTPIAGAVAPDLPISVRNTALPSGSIVVCPGIPGLCTSAGPLFPYSNGYSVGAGSCLPELQTAPAVNTLPGTSATTFGSPATMPLGVLAVKVVTPSGKPVQGATVKATVADTSNPPCDSLSLTLGTTETDGTLAVTTIYERYTLAITKGSATTTVTIRVSPSSQTVSSGSGTPSTQPLPTQAEVTLP